MPQIKITLIDEEKGRRLEIALPDDVPLAQLIPALARKLDLPEDEYTLTIEGANMSLPLETTLDEAGVSQGSFLQLAPKKNVARPLSVEAPPPQTSEPPASPQEKNQPSRVRFFSSVGGVVVIVVVLCGILMAGGVFKHQEETRLHATQTAQAYVNAAREARERETATAQVLFMQETATAQAIMEAPTEASLGDTWIRPVDGMTMVYVPAGSFEMGRMDDFWTNENPIHKVELDGFWIDRTEVTVAQFQRFISATGYQTSAEADGVGRTWVRGENNWYMGEVNGADWLHPLGPESTTQEDHPVVQVSWNDAEAYCTWVGANLPTEAEWEYAARGSAGFLYPWGNVEAQRCTMANDSSKCNGVPSPPGSYTSAAGSYPDGASWCGALDLVGNVWEWVNDWYADYSPDEQVNPNGPISGFYKVKRGGSWWDGNTWSTVRLYERFIPEVLTGFRCAVR